MSKTKKLFFIALLPPQEVRDKAVEIQRHFAESYASKAALKSPPHITLHPPFEWQGDALAALEDELTKFAAIQPSFPMVLHDFGAFKPRVIYINVLKTEELVTVYRQLNKYLEKTLNLASDANKNRGFSPHLTVAFRDLSKSNFERAWSQFQHQQIHYEFTVNQITLLSHNGSFWEIYRQFDLVNCPQNSLPQ